MRLASVAAALTLAACGHPAASPDAAPDAHADAHPADAPPDAGTAQVLVKDLPLQLDRDLDLLFVVDNSGTMREEQESLATNFPKFIQVLQQVQGGLPNVHIGVVSSDLGAGDNAFTNCHPLGDQGHLLQGPPGTHCPALDAGATFLSDVASTGGARVTNYTGDLGTVFSCMAQLGTSGCGLESHLESMRAALDPSNTFNAGFLRPGAILAVVIIGDEDDCSASDPTVFVPSDAVKGPVNFRCTEYGITCDGDTDPLHMQTFGPRTHCGPREDSAYIYPAHRYVDFLKGLKADPNMVVVADLGGPAMPVDIEGDTYDNLPNDPALQASCASASGRAVPAVRRAAVAAAFGPRGSTASICSTDLSAPLAAIGEQIKEAVGDPCIEATLADADPATIGLQPDCTVTEVVGGGTPQEQDTALAACTPFGPGAHGNAPCWYLDADLLQCATTTSHLKLVTDFGGTTPPSGARLRAECRVE